MRILVRATFLLSLVFTLALVSARVVAVPQVMSTDSVGNPKSEFQLPNELFVKGSGFPANQNMKAYIIPDGSWPPHMSIGGSAETLSSKAVASVVVTTDGDGMISVTLVWSPPLTPGKYDIWVDVNMNGVFDDGDVLNNQAIDVYAFFVVSEAAVIVYTLLIFGALATSYFMGKRKLSRKQKKYEPAKAKTFLAPIKIASEPEQQSLNRLTKKLILLNKRLGEIGHKLTSRAQTKNEK